MSREGYVTRTYGGDILCADFWCRNLKENNHLKDQVLDGRMILKRTVINKT